MFQDDINRSSFDTSYSTNSKCPCFHMMLRFNEI